MSESRFHYQNVLTPQIDPDPVSIFLCVLGALGSLASIATYMEHRKELGIQQDEQEKKTRQGLTDLLLSLELEFAGLTDLLENLQAILHRSMERPSRLSEIPFEFGGYRPSLTQEAYRTYIQTLLAVNRKVGNLIEFTGKILELIYSYKFQISSQLFDELIKFRADLNLLLKSQMNYEEAFPAYYEIIKRSEILVRELKDSLRKRKIDTE